MVDSNRYILDFLKINHFVFEGKWDISIDGKVVFCLTNSIRNTHCVYIWLAKKQDASIPLYVGKAKNGVFDRMKQHMGGFREDKNGSVSGRRKRKILSMLLNSNWTIEVHAKESCSTGSMDLFYSELFKFKTLEDENIKFPCVSLYSIEEELLIRFFELNFPCVTLMNGLKDKDADPVEFLNRMNSL